MTEEQENCKFCHQVPQYGGGRDQYENEIEIVHGGWTSMYIGVAPHGEIFMNACGDDYTENYYPKFCPECGRKLQ